MDPIYAFTFEGLDLRDKRILDAATGAGESTARWAAAIASQGGTGRILSVDHDLPEAWRARVLERLGEHAALVELRELDVFDLGTLEAESFDIVNCHETLVFLNREPLRVLQALRAFHRVLRPGGLLVVTSETRLSERERPGHEGQWRRWNLAKAVYALKGDVWAAEIEPADLEVALRLAGFQIEATRLFEPRATEAEAAITEWREVLEREVASLPWDDVLCEAIRAEVSRVAADVLAEGRLMSPPRFVTKARKLDAP